MSAEPDIRAALLDALTWQVELGVTEAISDEAQDRFAESIPGDAAARPVTGAAAAAPRGHATTTGATTDARPGPEATAEGQAQARTRPIHRGTATPGVATVNQEQSGAHALAQSASSLEELATAMQGFEGSDLRHGARSFVFADGNPAARVMVIGEAPGGDEDRIGKPFVGRAGQLLDRMLAAIGISRTAPASEDAAYISNILPWRPPGNRTPSEAEVSLFLPFMIRHIELAQPDIILSLGNTPTKGLLATGIGIKRMRGTWRRHEATGLPLLPSFHPAYLLRSPEDKRLAWRDLLSLRAVLDGQAPDI